MGYEELEEQRDGIRFLFGNVLEAFDSAVCLTDFNSYFLCDASYRVLVVFTKRHQCFGKSFLCVVIQLVSIVIKCNNI